jgi:cytochrome d ubiquinol oxidase subunit II
VAGLASIVSLARRSYVVARLAAGLAVTAVVWGWAAAQYPYLLVPYLTIADAAATRTTLQALFVTLLLGAVVLVPSLWYLYTLFQRDPTGAGETARAGAGRHLGRHRHGG